MVEVVRRLKKERGGLVTDDWSCAQALALDGRTAA